SRQTELAAEYPIHVVCEWIGNSAAIASKHYLTVREDDFERAAKSGAVAVQNAVQQGPARPGDTTQVLSQVKANCGVVQDHAKLSGTTYYPQGDSNPCLSRERAMS